MRTCTFAILLCITTLRGWPQEHWSLKPITNSPVPKTNKSTIVARNPIDAFIARQLQQAKLKPSPEADRHTLIRRLHFDLHGLPPTPEVVEAFVRDPNPKAYEKLVDRLLASPHFGERFARHWLDIAHYADTHGFERDKLRPDAWPYRDYVIRAFNADKPYDRFLQEQIAGDVLWPDDPDAVVATGFLAAGPWDFVGQVETKSPIHRRSARALDLDDMMTQVMTATTAMTVNCARCHDHKIDNIPQEDYYRLTAVFAGLKRGSRNISDAAVAQHNNRKQAIEDKLSHTQFAIGELEGRGIDLADVVGGGNGFGTGRKQLTSADQKKLEQLRRKQAQLEKELANIGEPPKFYGVIAERPPVVKVLHRGNPELPRDPATPGSLRWVAGLKADLGNHETPEGQRRAALARWITHPYNPLTHRVIVNRLWQWHFGRGIVDTPSDFGRGGQKPTHPELLDWLAKELRTRNGSLKAITRLIATSATYRQVSHTAHGTASDADNRYLWRQNPRRLQAEAMRDAVLATSGKLNFKAGGSGYRDFKYTETYAPIYRYITPDTPDLWRRSIYRFVVRTTPHEFLTILDCPDPANLTPKRLTTTTPLQALTLSNNPFMLTQVGYFAERLKQDASAKTADQIDRAFRLALSRQPTPAEAKAALQTVRDKGLFALCLALLNVNEFAYVD
ncbi:MAG: DUF1549 and DUF1553 domain-containing protein [Verrucomicrobiota bacterium]|nr:DUF1549 and DUF1553 domain-containing protein [Verrucomicrobiota bacterium]